MHRPDRPRRPWRRRLAPVAVAAALLAAVWVSRAQDAATTGPAGGPATGSAAGRGADEQAARAAAQRHLGLLSGGDWSGAWADFGREARQRVPRDTYVRVHRACHPLLAVPLQVERAVAADARTVDAHWRGGGTSGTLRMRHEDGRWRVAMTPDQLAPYARGADSAIAALRRNGQCGDGVRPTPAAPAPSAG
ncbi:hypothetical protein ACIRNI_12085 [Streptomyces sp. NPDC093546]|uniref:hypothetical protein n=1 Tax=Streptomyces sp. NPDC093546 TaxID=3366040 RepID=UPI0037F10366